MTGCTKHIDHSCSDMNGPPVFVNDLLSELTLQTSTFSKQCMSQGSFLQTERDNSIPLLLQILPYIYIYKNSHRWADCLLDALYAVCTLEIWSAPEKTEKLSF